MVDLAFLEAFNAGIFVATSAGNDGPGEATVAHTGPWTAASRRDHALPGIRQHPRRDRAGACSGRAHRPARRSRAAARPIGETSRRSCATPPESHPRNDTGCQPFEAGAFAGALAMVDRGDCDFSVKVTNAADAGAVAVLVANNVGGPPTAMGLLEETTIPAAMIEQGSAAALRAAAGGAILTARLNATTELVPNHAWEDLVAGFSSRGPSHLDLLAPSFAAPGVDILAAGAASATATRTSTSSTAAPRWPRRTSRAPAPC